MYVKQNMTVTPFVCYHLLGRGERPEKPYHLHLDEGRRKRAVLSIQFILSRCILKGARARR